MELCIVLTSRGNYAKLKRIMELANLTPGINLKTIVGGDLLLKDKVTSYFNIQPDKECYFNVAGDRLSTMSKSVSLAISEFTSAFEELKPDYVMLVGDRFETFGAATAAYICGVPIIHLEGGEVSGTLDNSFRYAISEFSAIHFPCTEKSAENLKKFEHVYNVGATSLDSIKTKMSGFNELQEKSGSGVTVNTHNDYLLVIYHPDTKYPESVKSEITALIEAVDTIRMPTIWINSNMDAGAGEAGHILRMYRDKEEPNFIHFFKSLPIE